MEEEHISHLTYILGYILYGENLSKMVIQELSNCLKDTVNQSFFKKLKLKRLHNQISSGGKIVISESADAKTKEENLKTILPKLMDSNEVMETLSLYLKDKKVLEYLDYPELPGEFGWCGHLVQENVIWDRYYESNRQKSR